MKRARGRIRSFFLAMALGWCASIALPHAGWAQVGVTPSFSYTVQQRTDTGLVRQAFLMPLSDRPTLDVNPSLLDYAQGTSITGSLGRGGQADVSTQAIRFGIYGKPTCTEANGVSTCEKHLVFSARIDSHIVDAFGQPATAIKQYILSDRGSPLTLTLPPNLPVLSFSTQVPGTDVPQSYAAGQLSASARLVPFRLGDGSISNNGSLSIGYSLEGHVALRIGDVDGTVFGLATPSFSYVLGDSLQTAISATGRPLSRVAGLSYRVGYQFGTGTAVTATGNFAFTSLRDGRRQLSLALNQALGAIGGKR